MKSKTVYALFYKNRKALVGPLHNEVITENFYKKNKNDVISYAKHVGRKFKRKFYIKKLKVTN